MVFVCLLLLFIIQDCCYWIQNRGASWKEKKKWIAPPPPLWGSFPAINPARWVAATNGCAFLNSLAVPTVHAAVIEAIFLSRYWFPMELSFEMMDLQLGWDLEERWLCLCCGMNLDRLCPPHKGQKERKEIIRVGRKIEENTLIIFPFYRPISNT